MFDKFYWVNSARRMRAAAAIDAMSGKSVTPRVANAQTVLLISWAENTDQVFIDAEAIEESNGQFRIPRAA